MPRAHIFPEPLVVLDLGAAVVSVVEADMRRTVYWLAAAMLTVAVTW